MGKLINTVGQRGQPFFVCFDERKLKDEKSNNLILFGSETKGSK